MRNEIEAGKRLEAALLTLWAVSLSAGFALGWVAHYWWHRG